MENSFLIIALRGGIATITEPGVFGCICHDDAVRLAVVSQIDIIDLVGVF